MKKTLFLIRGLPGSGKTSAAKSIAGEEFPILCEDDWYHDEHGHYHWTAEKEVMARQNCLIATESLMLGDGIKSNKIFVTNVFATKAEMQPYLDLGARRGYNVVSFLVENRHGNESIHNVNTDDYKRMRETFEVDLD